MDKLKKINLIEFPHESEVSREELEEALGGWNCGTFNYVKCVAFDTGVCSKTNGATMDYCSIYTAVSYQ